MAADVIVHRHELSSRHRLAQPQQPVNDLLDAGFTARPALRSVEIDSDEAPVRLPRRIAQANVAVLDRPHPAADDLVVPRLELYDRLSGAARVTQLSAAAGRRQDGVAALLD